jgi:hypothetical protein
LPSVSCSITRLSDSFLKMTWKVDEAANFVFVQLIEHNACEISWLIIS